MVDDNWHDVDGGGLRLIEMMDDTPEGRCKTGAFDSSVHTMWRESWGRSSDSAFRDGLSMRPHDLLPGAAHAKWGKYKPGIYYARRTWGTNSLDPICRNLAEFPAYFTIKVGAVP